MKKREINTILSKHGQNLVNLRVLDVGEYGNCVTMNMINFISCWTCTISHLLSLMKRTYSTCLDLPEIQGMCTFVIFSNEWIAIEILIVYCT